MLGRKNNTDKALSLDEQINQMEDNFVKFTNVLTEADIFNYPYIRQDKKTGKFERVQLRIHVEEITEEEARDIINREDTTKVE